MSVVQNLAVPFSLEIEPPAAAVRDQATRLAREVLLPEDTWEGPAAALDAEARVRLRMARALALNPQILLLEHPTVSVDRSRVEALARDIRAVAERRHATAISLTMDREFAEVASTRLLTLDAATGRINEGRLSKIRFWS
jgi:ABC-type lipoprotein export system ATPase subunit